MWQPWKTLNTPLVWVLHAAYAWIVLHLAFRAMAAMEWMSVSAGNHALTAGAIGSMVIGMMTRTALGHTGRKLVAGKTEVACYTLVATAAVVRVFRSIDESRLAHRRSSGCSPPVVDRLCPIYMALLVGNTQS
jgi:uncharacterized protein involved in response to NO